MVKAVVAQGTDEVPLIVRPQLADAWREELLAQHAACGGNLIRVHEELLSKGAKLSSGAHRLLPALGVIRFGGHQMKGGCGVDHGQEEQARREFTAAFKAGGERAAGVGRGEDHGRGGPGS